jgi:hypothetical protein
MASMPIDIENPSASEMASTLLVEHTMDFCNAKSG